MLPRCGAGSSGDPIRHLRHDLARDSSTQCPRSDRKPAPVSNRCAASGTRARGQGFGKVAPGRHSRPVSIVSVAMVKVRVMRVGVDHRLVDVRMGMRLPRRVTGRVNVPVMLIVPVPV